MKYQISCSPICILRLSCVQCTLYTLLFILMQYSLHGQRTNLPILGRYSVTSSRLTACSQIQPFPFYMLHLNVNLNGEH